MTPTIGILSTGDGNSYDHPTADCLERLHKANVKTFWTENGNRADPEPGPDKVGGNILVQMELGATTFSVASASGLVQTFKVAGNEADSSS